MPEASAATSSKEALFEKWWSFGSTIIAPATLLSTLLFYFGYVSSRAQYRYFGVDVDTAGLSTQDYVMRSPQALLVPLLTIALGGGVLLLLHRVVRRHPPPPIVVRLFLGVAGVALVVGVGLIVAFARLGGWPYYPLVTPLAIAAGSAGVLYGIRLPGAPNLLRAAPDESAALSRGILACALVVVVACLFWATATLAQWTGTGNGMRTARHLSELAPVTLDTQERLILARGVDIVETSLPAEKGDRYRYRYTNLRLLIQGDGLLFLVPGTWSPSNSTLVVPLDGSVRVWFRFVSQPPD